MSMTEVVGMIKEMNTVSKMSGSTAETEDVMKEMKEIKAMNWEDASRLGYPVEEPRRVSKKLDNLCNRLGAEYHLARVYGGNSIHRVIGSGWDIEIFPICNGSDHYKITLRSGYGSKPVYSETGIKDKDDAIKCMVEMMLHIYVPESVYPTRYQMGPRPKK